MSVDAATVIADGRAVARHRARLDPHQGVPDRTDDPPTVLAAGSPRVGEPVRGPPVDLRARRGVGGSAGRLRRPRRRRPSGATARALETFGAIGVSAMMHGYLAFDADGELLVPFRTWRNTNTGSGGRRAHATLFGVNIPLRWSIAHLHQAVLDAEAHVPQIAVRHHARRLRALEAHRAHACSASATPRACSRSTPPPATTTPSCSAASTRSSADRRCRPPLADLLPEVLVAGAPRRRAHRRGRARCSTRPARCSPASRCCPPEGDAGTGMVATNSVAPRTGNVSAGTSIFAMVVLERPLASVHHELDLVTTPAGDPVAMVHCNNGASELAAWAGLFTPLRGGRRSARSTPTPSFDVAVPRGARGRGGCRRPARLQPPRGRADRRARRGPPAVRAHARQPRSRWPTSCARSSTACSARSRSACACSPTRASRSTGCSRTAACSAPPGVAQRFLAGALDAPVAVGETASEGGAWGIAVLAAVPAPASRARAPHLGDYLDERVFAAALDHRHRRPRARRRRRLRRLPRPLPRRPRRRAAAVDAL